MHPEVLHLIQNTTSISHYSLHAKMMSRTPLWHHRTVDKNLVNVLTLSAGITKPMQLQTVVQCATRMITVTAAREIANIFALPGVYPSHCDAEANSSRLKSLLSSVLGISMHGSFHALIVPIVSAVRQTAST